jgi:hypothetical protein
MAQPNQKHPEIGPNIRPRLGVIQGGGESTPDRADLHGADNTTQDLNNQERNLGVIQGGGESTPDRGNLSLINSAKEKEAATPTWDTHLSGDAPKKQPLSLRGFTEKNGPMGLIIAIFLGGGGLLTFFASPGIAIVQLKEAFVHDLNDQARAMDIQTDLVLRAKLKKLQVGLSICTNAVSVRCKYATFSKTRVQAFMDAGFTIEPTTANIDTGDPLAKRTKPTKIIFPDGFAATNPNELRDHMVGNAEATAAVRQGFNSGVAAFWDKPANDVLGRNRTDKSQKIEGQTEEERNKSVTTATAGETSGVSADGTRADPDGRRYVYDEQGTKIYEADNPGKFASLASIAKSGLASLTDAVSKSKAGAKALTSTLSAGFKGASLLGTADTACTVNNTARAVAAAAKVARAIQLAQFFMAIVGRPADRIKDGTATPEETEHSGNVITSIDTNKQVIDENSTWAGSSPQTATATTHDNPYYNQNALDSPGYAVAAYNEAPTLTARDLQYTIGGGLVGGLSGVLDAVAKVLGGRENIQATCHVVQSWWARGAGLIAGIISAAGSFGASAIVSIGASIAIGMAAPLLEAMLADIIAGNVVNGETRGVDAGDAAFAGAAVLMGGMAAARGMKPAKSSEIKSYLAATQDKQNDVIAAEIYDAKKTPFDINNQYSFLGSVVRKVNPALVKSSSSISGALSAIPSIVIAGFSSTIPSVSAATVFNPERYKKCSNDEGYRQLGIDADVFCNVRFIMSDKQLAMEPDDTAAWMEANGHIEADGTPKSEEYQTWIKACTQRQNGYGETSSDDNVTDADTGKLCMNVNDTIDHFAVFTMQNGIQDAMDVGFQSQGSTTLADAAASQQANAALPEQCKTMAATDLGQIACQAYKYDNYGYLWGGGHGGTAAGFVAKFKAGDYQAGKDSILDCSGLVRMSIFEATGVDVGGMGTSSYPSYSKFKPISNTEAKAGDILWFAHGHTEIVVSNDTAGKKFATFGAHTAKTAFPRQVGPSSFSYGEVSQVFRFQR